MMTRRGWFASLLAPAVVQFIPASDLPLPDDLFVGPSISARLKMSGAYGFSGGLAISQPFIYAPAPSLDTQVNQTIHNPPQIADGAN